jgi:cyclohexa-1,5-dienecarbonyl-CoA hydratase
MSYQSIEYQVSGNAATITLNTPPLNILDIRMMREMIDVIDTISADNNIMALKFVGAGDKAFSAGASIEEHSPDQVEEMINSFHTLFRKLVNSDLVTVAQVHGHALGGGCELALICDFVVASDDAKFALPEIMLGCFPPVAAALLPMLIGPKQAERLMITGESLSAESAKCLGLITGLCERAELGTSADKLMSKITSKSPGVIRLLRKSAPNWREEFLTNLDRAERVFLNELVKLEDMQEGLTSYSEKRKPVWQNF